MVFTLIIMVIILLVLIPVGIVVDKKIEASPYYDSRCRTNYAQNTSLTNSST